MFFEACRAGLLCLLSCFCLARQLHNLITASRSCQQLFYTFLRKFSEAVYETACIKFFWDKKMKRTILSITSVHFIFLSGERGIWTLAPVLPTYSLSRGAPSASWVFLQKDTYQCGILNYYNTKKFFSGEDGIRTHVPVRTNGFQDRLVMTASIPLRIGILFSQEKLLSRANKWYISKKDGQCQQVFRDFFKIFLRQNIYLITLL